MPKRCRKCKVPLEGIMIKGKKFRVLLAEGYTEMAGEAIRVTREFEGLDTAQKVYD